MDPMNVELEALKAERDALQAELAAMRARQAGPSSMNSNTIYGALQRIGTELHHQQQASNLWRDTPLSAINELKPDPAGKVGEELIKFICAQTGIPNESTGDKNSKDGTYDQKIGTELKKVEIKTGRLGGGKYQHEHLQQAGYDYNMFIDLHPRGGHITILPPFPMKEKNPITGTSPTLRKGTSDVYKWDFTDLHLKKLVAAGKSMPFDDTTPFEALGEFIRASII
jgi:hypothetical protein